MSFVGPVQCKVDMSGFNRGFELASQVTKRTPGQAANRAGLEVAVAAQKDTPFVTPETIDTELSVMGTAVIGKRGKPLKRKKRIIQDPSLPIGKASLAVLVIQARANPQSNYNLLTNGRYALSHSPFKGLSRAAGRAAMASMIDVMVKNRHRSGHFIGAGWVNSIRTLIALDRGRGASRPNYLEGNEALGSCQPAKKNSTNTACIIENDVGLEGVNAESNNRALVVYGMPALQAALDGEGRNQMDYFLSKVGKEELEAPVNKAWG